MRSTSPSTLIFAAAKQALGPIGMHPIGRSRVWIADHGWRLDVVEFQPGNWSSGSYLNIAVSWLWSSAPVITLDEVERVGGLRRFEDDSTFADTAKSLAETARAKVIAQRQKFPSLTALSDFYVCVPRQQLTGWRTFHAALAHGIVGRGDKALALLSEFASTMDTSIEWQRDAAQDASQLQTLVRDPDNLRRDVAVRITKRRNALGLPEAPIDFGT